MTTSSVSLTPGDGTKKAATYSVSEDAVTKEIQRVSLNDSAGAAITTLPVSAASLPLPSGAATAANQATIITNTTPPTIKFAAISTSSSGATQVVAAVTSKKIRVLGYTLIANGSVNVKFQSAANDKTGLLYLIANAGASANSSIGVLETVSGEALNINLSSAVAVGGHLAYIEV